MTTHINALEDRILVLQDQVDSLVVKAGFDPNEPRGKGGKWSSGGGSSPAKGVAGWLSRSKVAEALKGRDLTADAKELLATTVATIITTHNNDDQATEAIKHSILHLSAGLKVSAHDAREHVSGVVNRLRTMRRKDKPEVAKAEDEVLALLDSLLKLLDGLDLEDAV